MVSRENVRLSCGCGFLWFVFMVMWAALKENSEEEDGYSSSAPSSFMLRAGWNS